MAEHFEFPSKSVRDWAIYERELRSMLQSAAAPHAVEEELVSRMKPFVELLQWKFMYTAPPICSAILEPQLKNFTTALNERNSRLFIERVQVELEICRLKGML